MNKLRFQNLIEKYKQARINRAEYQELLQWLNEPGIEIELDQVLDLYWEEAKSNPPLSLDSSNSESLPEKRPEHLLRSNKTTDPVNPRFKKSVWWGIAASLIAILGFFIYSYSTQNFLNNKEIVYKTGYGERQEITLNDGSQITLNANSEFRWNENWKSKDTRKAFLKGEAFFEVEKQNGVPFLVETEDVLIEVIGTSFNVKCREKNTKVYLDEGEVNLKLLETADDSHVHAKQEITMKPGDQVRYSASMRTIEKTEGQSMISAAAWKNNVLNFKNMQFSEVLDLLRDIYGQSFECSNGELLRTPMYLGVPYSDWEAVRQALELSLNIEFQQVENRRYKVIRIKR